MTTAPVAHVVPREPARLPELAAADRGVANSLEAVLSDNTKRTYETQWRLFDDWCGEVGLRSLPAESLTVARYLAARAGRGVETPEQAAERARFDVALVAVLSDAGLRRSEASSLTWGDVQRWDDGSGRITVIRFKTDAEA